MKHTLMLLIATLLAVSSAIGAPEKEKKKTRRFDCRERVEKAIARYEKGRYNDVRTKLDEVRYQCGGHSVMDTVLYYLGMAHLRGKQPLEAKGHFERLVQHYPNSVFAREALFRIGHAGFLESNPYNRDQTETRRAIRELRVFIETYPESPLVDSARIYLDKCNDKLAHKQYSSARFYHRIDEYEAAIVYYRTLVEEYPRSAYVGESKLYMAQALAKINRGGEALSVVEELLEGDYREEIRRKARQLRASLKKGSS